MTPLVSGLLVLQSLIRTVIVTIVGAIAVLCLIDWLVRTRRINPFHPIAKFLRQRIDPLIAPMERRVVSAGGSPAVAPWWTLAVAVVAGIVIMSVVNFVFEELGGVLVSISSGPMGIFYLLLHWTFMILRTALLVRVIISWLPISPYSVWVRWAFVITEPLLQPLRSVIPTIGMFDLTPLIAYFLLGLLEGMIGRIA